MIHMDCSQEIYQLFVWIWAIIIIIYFFYIPIVHEPKIATQLHYKLDYSKDMPALDLLTVSMHIVMCFFSLYFPVS